MTQGQVGFLVTGYAWIITVLPMTLLTHRVDRRVLFLWLLAIITLCNGLALVTHHYWLLIILRIVAALGHGVFWLSIASYAIKIKPTQHSITSNAEIAQILLEKLVHGGFVRRGWEQLSNMVIT